jgi:DNA-binding MarR family transcriptional regulator
MSDSGFSVLVGRIRKAIRREFDAEASQYDITVPQFLVLRRLWAGDGIHTCVLTRDASSDGGTITGVLDRLEAKELIRRERSAEDRRAVCIYLTDAGRELERPLLQIIDKINQRALKCLNQEESEKLLSMLRRIGEYLGA